MDPLRLRIARVVSRIVRWAIVETSGNDSDPYQTQEVSYLGKNATSQVWWPYGFNAVAPRGTLSLMFAVGGDAGSTVHIPGSPRERVKVRPGEVVLYHPGSGAKVHMQEDGSIQIDSDIDVTVNSAALINVVAPAIDLTGDVDITGTLTVSGQLDANGVLNANDDLNDQLGVEVSTHIHGYLNGSTPSLTDGPEGP